ncbi:MAG: response regulator receiver protein [Actinomycetia bacterium]|nr:response regulator receiver protein [Actinomycetes bacterium]
MPEFDEGRDGRPITIVLIEDDPGDVVLTRDALADSRLSNELVVLSGGADALAYLRGEGQYAGREAPGLILLDLNLPGVSGREVLALVRTDPRLSGIPVAVLTASSVEEDLLRSQALGVVAYLRKPVQFEGLAHVVRSVESFCLRIDRAATA